MAEPQLQRHAGTVHAREDDAGGDEDRRVRPRHDDSSLSATIAAIAPASILYDHALQSIFLFLELTELANVACTLKAWRSIVCVKMPSVGLWLYVQRRSLPAAAGPLARHVRMLDYSRLQLLSAAELLSLAQPHWCNLRSLHMHVTTLVLEDLVFPPQLCELTLGFHRESTSGETKQLLEAVRQMPKLETLSLEEGCCLDSLAPLQRAASLRVLFLQNNYSLRHRALDGCRRLTQLRTLVVRALHSTDLIHLVQPPHQLMLEEISPLWQVYDCERIRGERVLEMI